jgi:hypothetical protein
MANLGPLFFFHEKKNPLCIGGNHFLAKSRQKTKNNKNCLDPFVLAYSESLGFQQLFGRRVAVETRID